MLPIGKRLKPTAKDKAIARDIKKQINRYNSCLRTHKGKKYYYHFTSKSFYVSCSKITAIVYSFIFKDSFVYMNTGADKPLKKFKLSDLEDIKITECNVKRTKEYIIIYH